MSYLLDTHSFSMDPGHQQQLDRSYTISFDTGAGGQQKKYQLAAGVYEWRLEQPQGWNLYKVNLNIVIDNSRYDGEFRYLLNNEYQSVGPGQVAEHAGDKLFELVFDPGNGGAEVRKLLKSGRYIIGIDPDFGRLDLFEASKVDAVMAEQPQYLSSTRYAGNNATRSQRVEALLAQIERTGEPLGGRSTSGVNLFGSTATSSARTISAVGPTNGGRESVDDLLNSLKRAD
ncbi:MAG: hypothetical protein HY000_06675 [Planctomycetes bacterium]|nr:hypothetical protein [Planctomycetota bacterium]